MTGHDRFIDLTDASFQLRADAFPRLLSTMYYPDCPESIEQATSLIMSERSRYQSLGYPEFKPSKLSELLLAATKRQSSQVYLAGNIALALGYRANYAEKLLAEDAYAIVSKLMELQEGRAQYVDRTDGVTSLTTINVPAGKSSLKKALDTYKTVLPICAAANATAHIAASREIYKESPKFEQRFLNTAVFFQEWMGDVYEETNWRRWLIDPNAHAELPINDEHQTPTFLSPGFLQNIMTAYDAIFPDMRETFERAKAREAKSP